MEKQFQKVGLMIDCSRNAVYKIEFLKDYIPLFSALGYNVIQLYTEDTYLLPTEPYFGYLRGGYSQKELKELIEFAEKYGVEIMPCIQTLAHLNCLLNLPKYQEYKDVNDILLADYEKTYELIEKSISYISKTFKSKSINIGMDEASLIGLGRHLKLFGYQSTKDIMKRHLNKVASICEKYSLSPVIWSDMLFDISEDGTQYVVADNVSFEIPSNVKLCYWDYYHTETKHYEKMVDVHKKFNKDIYFAGGSWSWTGFAPNNNYAYKTFKNALPVCKQNGITDVYLTVWGDDGAECPLRAVLPAIFLFSEVAYKRTRQETESLFYKQIGVEMNDFLLIDNLNYLSLKVDEVQNPSKYMLYNDIFLGQFDCTICADDSQEYEKLSKELSLVDTERYKDMFMTYSLLAKILAIKCDIGLNLRSAYREKNIKSLKDYYKKLGLLIKLLKKFKTAFEKTWHKEKKPFGYEVQEARLSGIIGRAIYCRKKVKDFYSKKIERIEELDLDVLDYNGNINFKRKKIVFNDYKKNITTGVM